MKKTLFFILAFCLALNGFSQTVSPLENTEICPDEYVGLQFTFDGTAVNYSIKTDATLKGCIVISNINSNGWAAVKFTDKKEVHSFTVIHSMTSAVKTFTYTRIKTIDGIKPTWQNPPSILSPGYINGIQYDDVLSSSSYSMMAPCGITTFNYTTPGLKYKDTDGNEYGTQMAFYEWLVPAGWRVNGTISDGVNPIDAGSPSADITPHPITTGELKCRAKNNCNPPIFKKSDWYRILINGRPTVKLAVNGVNPLPIICGDVADKTFTLENIGYFGCATAFEWTIGSNWLLPNGSSPPPTMTTPTPSLTLKPNGNYTPGTVSVRAYIYGVWDSHVFSCPVTFNSTPLLTINGPTTICSGSAVYNVVGLPPNSSVVWSANPSFLVNLAPGANNTVNPFFY